RVADQGDSLGLLGGRQALGQERQAVRLEHQHRPARADAAGHPIDPGVVPLHRAGAAGRVPAAVAVGEVVEDHDRQAAGAGADHHVGLHRHLDLREPVAHPPGRGLAGDLVQGGRVGRAGGAPLLGGAPGVGLGIQHPVRVVERVLPLVARRRHAGPRLSGQARGGDGGGPRRDHAGGAEENQPGQATTHGRLGYHVAGGRARRWRRSSRRWRRRAPRSLSPGKRMLMSTPPMTATPRTRSSGASGSGVGGERLTFWKPPMMAVPCTSTASPGGTRIWTPPKKAFTSRSITPRGKRASRRSRQTPPIMATTRKRRGTVHDPRRSTPPNTAYIVWGGSSGVSPAGASATEGAGTASAVVALGRPSSTASMSAMESVVWTRVTRRSNS